MIAVTENLSIPDEDIEFRYVHASGPGGQNVNKVATAVQLRLDLEGTRALDSAVKNRLRRIARNRINREGVLVINARRHRTQYQNRTDAAERLAALVQKALVPPRPRRPTRPKVAAKRRRLEEKRRRGGIKRLRKPVSRGNHE